MMPQRYQNKSVLGVLLLFLVLLTSGFLAEEKRWADTPKSVTDGRVFVKIGGDVRHEGIYGFDAAPRLKQLIRRSGGVTGNQTEGFTLKNHDLFRSGCCVVVENKDGRLSLKIGEMSAFYRMTLGIPLSLNRENLEGLAALPGIGPVTARSIVRERTRRGGFKKLEEILSVPGIGSATYRKIRPYLAL